MNTIININNIKCEIRCNFAVNIYHFRNFYKSYIMTTRSYFTLSLSFVLLLFVGSCKKEKANLIGDNIPSIQKNEQINTAGFFGNLEDSRKTIEEIITTKSFYKKEKNYIIDYKYPHLDVSSNPSFKNFNDFISNNYLSTDVSVKNTLNEIKLKCDLGYNSSERHKRLLNYKIYSQENIFSILLYKANHYINDNQSSYMFKALNFDPKKAEFITYNNIFKDGSEIDMLNVVNETLTDYKKSEPQYEECWQLDLDTFQQYKNNFVINHNTVKFYFDDCIICPIYSGSYAVEIPRSKISNLFKKKA